MVDSAPGMPGDAGTFPAYRGDVWARTFQFVDLDTSDWEIVAQVRRYPDSDDVLATFDIETNYQSDPTLVRVSLDETASKSLAATCLPCDLELQAGTGVEDLPRTMLKWLLDVDPDVTRIEEGS